MPKAKTNLVIVESPSKAKTIGKYLGSEYEVKACMGHLRDLPKSTMGVDLENNFEPVYQPVKGKEDIINDLKKSAKNSDQIFLATDPDREGEAISWHLQALLGIPEEKVRRVTAYLAEKGMENAVLTAGYGDTAGDAPILSKCLTPVLVRPKRKLKKLLPEATVANWQDIGK